MAWTFGRVQRASRVSRRPAAVAATAFGVALIAATAAFAGSAGRLDRSFGHDGIVVLPHFKASASSGAVGRHNRIVAVGGHNIFKITRTLPDGDVDRGFGNRGLVTVRFGSDEARPTSVAVGRKGGIVVAGTVCSGSNTCDFGVARLRPNGNLNRDFSGDGKVEISFPKPYVRDTSVALGGGRIIVAGSNGQGRSSVEWDIVLAALRGDGSLDPQFGQGGKMISSFAPAGDFCSRHAGFIQGMALDSRDRIVVDGECMRDERPGVARFKPNGKLDPSFSGDGVVNRDLGIFQTEALAVDNRDRIDVMGPHGHAWVVARLRGDGGLDRSFGKNGRAKASWGKSDRGTHVTDGAVDSHGRIVLGGSHGFRFAFVRFKPSGHLNKRFGHRGRVVVEDPRENFHLDLTGAVAIDKRDRIIGVGAQRRVHHSGAHPALVRLHG